MISLTIDGRAVSVEPGTTMLEAANRLGIRIPTMCHVPGVEPAASCFACAVQIEGRRTLSPSCAMPAADGMVVTNNSPDVRTARKMALELCSPITPANAWRLPDRRAPANPPCSR